MSGRTGKSLDDEDRVLWNVVARTVRPLAGKAAVAIPAAVLDPPGPDAMAAAAAATPALATAKPKVRPPSGALDQPTLDKLSKGRLPIEGKVDLHGMTQEQAYSLLFSFLHRAYAGGLRYVLVITGKGSSSGGDGVLRRSVPAWLATPAFRMLVSSHDQAARHHGGGGAIYVRLRRHRP